MRSVGARAANLLSRSSRPSCSLLSRSRRASSFLLLLDAAMRCFAIARPEPRLRRHSYSCSPFCSLGSTLIEKEAIRSSGENTNSSKALTRCLVLNGPHSLFLTKQNKSAHRPASTRAEFSNCELQRAGESSKTSRP